MGAPGRHQAEADPGAPAWHDTRRSRQHGKRICLDPHLRAFPDRPRGFRELPGRARSRTTPGYRSQITRLRMFRAGRAEKAGIAALTSKEQANSAHIASTLPSKHIRQAGVRSDQLCNSPAHRPACSTRRWRRAALAEPQTLDAPGSVGRGPARRCRTSLAPQTGCPYPQLLATRMLRWFCLRQRRRPRVLRLASAATSHLRIGAKRVGARIYFCPSRLPRSRAAGKFLMDAAPAPG
jgi:hypothetical protein